MFIERFINGSTRSNAYVYMPDDRERAAVIVDPGFGADEKIIDLVDAERLTPVGILCTHGHPDHVWTARRLGRRYEIPTYLHGDDRGWLADPATGGLIRGARLGGRLVARVRPLQPNPLKLLTDHEHVSLAGITFTVLHTPGHSRGSVCFDCADVCFSGDTVFRGTLGHTTYPGGSRSAMRRSLTTKLVPLPDDKRLLPGHGTETTVGDERERWEAFVGRD